MDPITGAALIGGAASLLGGKASAGYSAKQAAKQMEFQERMSNTAYQRAADDLEAAGLNRVLALGSPASTPGGAMGQVPDFGSAMAQGANAGINLASSAQGIRKQEAEVKKIIQETKNLSETEKRLAAEGALFDALKPHIESGVKSINSLIEKLADPEFMAEVGSAMTKATIEEVGAWQKVFMQHYNASVLEVSDFFSRVHESAKRKRINLGSGGPKQ